MRARFVRWFAAQPAWVGTALVLALLLSPARTLSAAPALSPETTEAQLSRARALGVARSLAWLRLLHYRPDLKRQPVSQVDGASFFLAKTGARDPEAELAATLRAFNAARRRRA